MKLPAILITALACAPGPEAAATGHDEAPRWHRCIVKASSHTGRYTFAINAALCEVYWREIGTRLKIVKCTKSEIKALKPSARTLDDVVAFDLKTGAFYDYLAGVYDRGQCIRLPAEPPR